MKPFYTRTEFWLTFLVAVLGAFLASDLVPQTHIAMKICGLAMTVLATLGYTVGRSYVKAKRPAPPFNIEDLTKLVGPLLGLQNAKKKKPKGEVKVVVDNKLTQEDVKGLFDEVDAAKKDKPEKPIIKKDKKKE